MCFVKVCSVVYLCNSCRKIKGLSTPAVLFSTMLLRFTRMSDVFLSVLSALSAYSTFLMLARYGCAANERTIPRISLRGACLHLHRHWEFHQDAFIAIQPVNLTRVRFVCHEPNLNYAHVCACPGDISQ